MGKILRLSDVGIFTADQDAARKFYTEKVGLEVRSSMPEFGYLALGAAEVGEDASMNLWQPTPDWGEEYEEGVRSIGTVTGLGFRTHNLEKTLETLSERGVKVEKETEAFARFWDADGNVLFLQEEPGARGAEPGLAALAWVTVVTADEEKLGRFYTSLGLRSTRVPGEEEGVEHSIYRLSSQGTAILPFTPVRDMYDDPADYEADMAHIGEDTSIMFLTDDAYALQDELLSEGIAFRKRAEERPWGGIAMRVYDPDKNHYMIVQMKE